MPTPLPAAEPTALEASFEDIAKRHDLTVVSVSHTVFDGGMFFGVNVHWDGYSRDGIGCAGHHSSTIEKALTGALAEAASKRALVGEDQFAADATLIEQAA